MKKEILIGTGLQGITIQFSIQDIIVMKDAISMNDGFIDKGKDFRAAIEQLTMMNQFLNQKKKMSCKECFLLDCQSDGLGDISSFIDSSVELFQDELSYISDDYY